MIMLEYKEVPLAVTTLDFIGTHKELHEAVGETINFLKQPRPDATVFKLHS